MRARLLNLARERGVAFDYVLNRYAVERLLYRLACSGHRDRFVLKGATLLRVWSISMFRPTRDVDLLGFGTSEVGDVAATISEICTNRVLDDGICFRADTVRASRIKEGARYQGVRVNLEAVLDAAKIPVQVDVGFGDAVTPREELYPVLLASFDAPRLRVYPRESVIAEKTQALVDLGLANTRMKDFWDIARLAGEFEFVADDLLAAVRATFERRTTAIPRHPPVALSSAFAADPNKQRQWAAFLRRTRLPDEPLVGVVEGIARLVIPVFAAAHGGPQLALWPAGGPWQLATTT